MLQQLLVDLQSSSKASSSTSRTRPTSFSISASEVEEQMKDIFGDAQGAIDAVNSEAKRLFEGSFSRTFEALRSVTDERQHVWQDLVLGKHGLAAYCSKLKQLLEEVDANTESCQKAQDLWKKKGRAATPGSGADGDKKPVENANEKHLLIQGCANEA
ncbi:unnamed protein product [Amoebophrya sp. A25]|nr:unnamed protein product [Amoebophrya sp. A25]|eukprot:GSA25T00004095001.1